MAGVLFRPTEGTLAAPVLVLTPPLPLINIKHKGQGGYESRVRVSNRLLTVLVTNTSTSISTTDINTSIYDLIISNWKVLGPFKRDLRSGSITHGII